jgi:uncharacterized protein (TIGR01777 family)
MKVLITGGLGFVGTQLSIRLLDTGAQITVVDHSPGPKPHTPKSVDYISADTTLKGPWQKEIANHDAIINLAGATIFRRWTQQSKTLMHESRVLTTRNIVEGIPQGKEMVLCSTSAVGYYGFRDDEEIAEEGPPGNDFLARLCVDWEKEALAATDKGARVVVPRLGIVLGKTGGALGQMIPAFKMFVGGPLGSGDQWFSWIHMEDLISAILFAIEQKDLEGPINLCSPNPVRNKNLAQSLGTVLRRPSLLKAPGFMIRAMLGEFGNVLLNGQRVLPRKLLKNGFVFQYPEIEKALREVIGKN